MIRDSPGELNGLDYQAMGLTGNCDGAFMFQKTPRNFGHTACSEFRSRTLPSCSKLRDKGGIFQIEEQGSQIMMMLYGRSSVPYCTLIIT